MTATDARAGEGLGLESDANTTMSSVSYSRADGTFVRRLQDALGDRGLKAWVDWQDIAPSAEWMSETLGAIESADTFVFLMSPDSLASEVCGRELDHAAQASKRKSCPSSAATSRVSMSPKRWRGSTGCSYVKRTISTPGWTHWWETIEPVPDLDRVKLHTRLLVRAREWERAGEDRANCCGGTI